MYKIKDRVFLGLVTGIISSVPGRLLNASAYKKGLTDAKYGQMAANLFVSKKKVDSKEGQALAR